VNGEDEVTTVEVVQEGVSAGFCGTVGVRVPVEGAETVELPPPPPDEVELPPPPPEEGGVTGMSANVADTVELADMMTVHVPVPEQAPDQPVNVESAVGVAVREMVVPDVTDVEHVDPQFKPLPVMVPVPVPDFDAETV
jgi:hypothetical protein